MFATRFSLLCLSLPCLALSPLSGQSAPPPKEKAGDAARSSGALTKIRLEKPKTILFLAGRRSHGYGSHEHRAGSMLIARLLKERIEGLETKLFAKGAWPKPEDFAKADSVVIFCDGGARHLVNKRLAEFDKVMQRGVGAVFLHYGVETVEGQPSAKFADWIGGYFERFWSVNPVWSAEYRTFPDHPVARGVQPFRASDEWYFHMRFRPKMKGVTPILSAVPPVSTMRRKDGPHSGNPAVRKAVKNKIAQHTAWAFDRPDGGRGFGFTGLHYHRNFKNDNFRKVVLNAVAWSAKIAIPKRGIVTATPTPAEIEANQDYPKPKRSKKRPKKQQPAKKLPVKK